MGEALLHLYLFQAIYDPRCVLWLNAQDGVLLKKV